MKVYIAGPMTGFKDFNRPVFNEVSADLVKAGHIPLNPAILPDGLTQPEYMDICLAMIRCADCVCLLPGWWDSAGAKAEQAIARKLGLRFMASIPDGESLILELIDGR